MAMNTNMLMIWFSLTTLALLTLFAKSLEVVSSKGKPEGAVLVHGALRGDPEHQHDVGDDVSLPGILHLTSCPSLRSVTP